MDQKLDQQGKHQINRFKLNQQINRLMDREVDQDLNPTKIFLLCTKSIVTSFWRRHPAGSKLALYILASQPTWLPGPLPVHLIAHLSIPTSRIIHFTQSKIDLILPNHHIFLPKAVIHLPANLPAPWPTSSHPPGHLHTSLSANLPAYLFPPASPPTHLPGQWPSAQTPACLPRCMAAKLPTELPVTCLPTYLFA